jgi:hypothetical protein
LAGNGFWYPTFNDELLEFQLEARVPEGWHLISQGTGSSHDDAGVARWDSQGPMDEIYLVGGPLVVYREAAGAVDALVYLHEPDDGLASKYLTTTAQYLEMYRDLIGPYPYGKFALVENFWETGYGMPTFTLLGPTIIRFPFILHSSYPHEILHNWWGNSVFVDFASGNWCEGLTAYLADHLVQEQRGKGAEYRRATLQKYRDYVKESRDFPLSEFRSRHSAATEAVGYGKTLMGFHMLRRHLGDQAFRAGLARFYRGAKGTRASFQDLQEVFEAVSEEDLSWFFEPWVSRPGAAELEIGPLETSETPEGFAVVGSLLQSQTGEPFPLEVPLVIQTASGAELSKVRLDAAESAFRVVTESRPLALHVDPEYDLFRKLDPRETPPSIGQIFGEPEIVAVLPAAAEQQEIEAYRRLMDGWTSDSHAIELRSDSDPGDLPVDRAVWLLGWGNRLAAEHFKAAPDLDLEIAPTRISLGADETPRQSHSLVVIRRHPANLEKAVGWLAIDPAAAFPGMGRKLPHYGKYSYLAFEGDEPTNVVKGQWPTRDSPLTVDLRPTSERPQPLASPAPPQRAALAELPPVFSEKVLMEHVTHLAAPELEGRGLDSPGLAQAAAYIAERFAAAGLLPGGDGGTFLQKFEAPAGPDGELRELMNVVGYLPGTESEWAEQSVILSAHYDHLGHGWPDVRQGNEGLLHPGADDNASGVAVLLELGKTFASSEKPKRNMVFIAFTGEEAGRLGSRHFVDHPVPFPLAGIRGVINLDTVGRLFDQKLTVLGTGTSREWPHIFRGSSFVTGVDSRNVAESTEGSDQASFIEKGIPAVQIFTRAHTDYHSPADTADKVDSAGLVRVATFVKEGAAYLAEREEPLTVTIAGPGESPDASPASGPTQGRRVRFGTIPDFAFVGSGVRVDGVVEDSPAARAGLQAGDILLRMDDREIDDLRSYSEILKQLAPGQKITVTWLRDGREVTVSAQVEAR